jgi:hypothetical protein
MRRVAAFALSLTLLACPAAAQDMAWSTIIPSVTGTDTLGMVLRKKMGQARRPSASPRNQPSTQPPPAPAPVAAGTLTYHVSLDRRRANLDAFVRKTRMENPALANDLASFFAARDTLGQLATAIAPYGLKIDNLGDALAMYWMVAWQTSQGRNDDFDRAAVTAVKDQSARALVEIRSIATANDAAKQEFAEALWIQAMLLDSAVERSKGDPATLRMLATRACQHSREMGIDLTAMTLTRQGFIPVAP